MIEFVNELVLWNRYEAQGAKTFSHCCINPGDIVQLIELEEDTDHVRLRFDDGYHVDMSAEEFCEMFTEYDH